MSKCSRGFRKRKGRGLNEVRSRLGVNLALNTTRDLRANHTSINLKNQTTIGGTRTAA